jgi:hypothetical protein
VHRIQGEHQRGRAERRPGQQHREHHGRQRDTQRVRASAAEAVGLDFHSYKLVFAARQVNDTATRGMTEPEISIFMSAAQRMIRNLEAADARRRQ